MTSNKTRVVRSAVAAAVIAAFAAGCSNESLPKLAEAHAAPAPAIVQPGHDGTATSRWPVAASASASLSERIEATLVASSTTSV